jgi:proliferating cell nuclear antigen PCNA
MCLLNVFKNTLTCIKMDNSAYIFKARSSSAHLFKVLSDILQTNLKTSCFQLKSDGIHLRQIDDNRLTLIDLKLDSGSFTSYFFNHPHESMFVGLTLTHLHKLLKTVKKKDTIGLFILTKDPTELALEVIPKENNRVTTSYLKIQRVQSILVDEPKGYGSCISIPSTEFQKIYKDILTIGKIVHLSSTATLLEFKVDAGGILKRRVQYGNINDKTPSIYEATFATEQLMKIAKIANLSIVVNIFTSKDLPLLISSKVGDMGVLKVFIKNREQIKNGRVA